MTTDAATVEFITDSEFSLEQGQSKIVIARFTPPAIDPKGYPAYSGHIEITSKFETVRVSYFGVLGSVHEQQLLDRSDVAFGYPLPLIKRPDGSVQDTTATYTFANGDYPTLVLRYDSPVDAQTANNKDAEFVV